MSALATPAEIAAIRRRYLLMAVSAAGVDIAFNLIFIAMNGAWSFAPRSVGISVVLLVGVNYLVAAGCSRRSNATSRARRASRTRNGASPSFPC